ncbi:MAG TPA: PAS domain-containing protein [Coleofasciculaceae cyanobacterium]
MTDQLPQKPLTPKIPANENERLAALHRYKILDTPAEASFDRITTLAARLFQVPTALISLVDESRAWFKSSIGFDAHEISRHATLCSLAVLMDEPLIIPDTRLDERFCSNPFVQSEPGMRFYASAPLITHDGFNLGTLCLLDTQPHDPLTAEQQATLIDLAAMVVDELELKLAAHQIAQLDAALQEITQGVATVTGEAFFDALVQHFAQVLDTDYVYIGLVEGDDPKMMRTIATCAHGQIVDNLEYALQETPCWSAIEQRKICCYPRNVQAQFPNAPLLKPLSVESYVAAPLLDSNGTVLGLLGVMDGEPLENVNLAESLLTIFASRIATELERQQAEAALRLNEAQLQTLLDAAPFGIYLIDQDFRIRQVNPIALPFFEKIVDLIGQDFDEVIHRMWPPEDADEVVQWFRHTLETGEAYFVPELIEERRDRRITEYYQWQINRVPLAEGRYGVVCYFRNISAQVQARQANAASEARLRSFVEANVVGIMFGDIYGAIYEANDELLRIVGYTREDLEAERLSWVDITPPEWLPLDEQAIAEARDRGACTPYEKEYIRQDGSRVSVLIGYSLIGEAREESVVFIVDLSNRKQAEAAVRESTARLKFLLEAAQFGDWDLNLSDRTASRSLRHDKIFGYESLLPEWTYEMFLDHVLPEAREEINRQYQSAINSNEPWDFECRIRRADDQVRWIWVSGYIYQNQGEATWMLGLVADITDRKQAEEALRESESRFQLATRAITGLIYDWNVQTGHIYRSEGLLRLVGVHPEAALPTADWWTERINPEDQARSHFDWKAAFAANGTLQDSYSVEYRVRHADGHWVYVWDRGCLLRDASGQVIRVVGSTADISERVQIERDRERILQQEQAARKEAEKANRIKDEFLAVLSHELRSPLNPILGWSQLLLTGRLNATQTAEALQTIRRNATLQSQLIEDLLDVSRILRGKLALNVVPVPLARMITAALETVRLAAQAKNIQIQTVFSSDVIEVSGDAGRLQQIVWNLLSNAVKFTPNGGRVEVRLTQIDCQAQIQVSDTGKGIAPDFLPYVFERFRQEDGATTRQFGGLGLGLAIAHQLVELHGGSVFVDSAGEDQGATFTIRLPLFESQGQEKELNLDSSSILRPLSLPLAGMRILVVDDEPDSRDFVVFVLEQAGADTLAMSSASEALQSIQHNKPDLLVSDIGMPEMDGYMLIDYIRNQLPPQYRDLLAIALTAYAGEANERQVLQAGFHQHLAKPIDPSVLVAVVTRLVAPSLPTGI